VSYFHGGDALHGFNRFLLRESAELGCVELAAGHAEVVSPYTPIGTLVTIAEPSVGRRNGDQTPWTAQNCARWRSAGLRWRRKKADDP